VASGQDTMRMNWWNNFSSTTGDSRPGGNPGYRVYEYAARQPGWINRTVAIAFALVIAFPILLLFAMAIAVSVALFGSLAALNAARERLRGWFRGWFGGSRGDLEGRRNVTVIRHDRP